MTPNDQASFWASIATTLSVLGVVTLALWRWGVSWLNNHIHTVIDPRILTSSEISDRKIIELQNKIKILEEQLETYAVNIDEIVLCASESIKNLSRELYKSSTLLDQILKWCEKDRSVEVSEVTYREWLRLKSLENIKKDDSSVGLSIEVILGLIHKIEQDLIKLKLWNKNYRAFVEKNPIEDIEQFQERLGIVPNVRHRLSQSSPTLGRGKDDSKSKKRGIIDNE